MADVTSALTRAGGLGTKPARWAFLFLWACGLWVGLVDSFTPLDPLNATGYLAALLGALLLTRRGSAPLPWQQVWVLPVIALYFTALALLRTPDVSVVWALMFATYLVAFLIPRGNPVAGGVGSALVIGYALAWGLMKAPSADGLGLLLGVPIGSVVAAIAWRMVLHWTVRKERLHRSAAVAAAERSRASEHAIAASQRELTDIRVTTTPLLSRLASGEPIDDATRTKLALVEASIRDRIRAPHLQHPLLVAELTRLRARGVIVVLLGEPASAGMTIEAPLADGIIDVIHATSEGRVTVRSLPEGRTAAASVVVQAAASSEQVLLAADGRVLSRT